MGEGQKRQVRETSEPGMSNIPATIDESDKYLYHTFTSPSAEAKLYRDKVQENHPTL